MDRIIDDGQVAFLVGEGGDDKVVAGELDVLGITRAHRMARPTSQKAMEKVVAQYIENSRTVIDTAVIGASEGLPYGSVMALAGGAIYWPELFGIVPLPVLAATAVAGVASAMLMSRKEKRMVSNTSFYQMLASIDISSVPGVLLREKVLLDRIGHFSSGREIAAYSTKSLQRLRKAERLSGIGELEALPVDHQATRIPLFEIEVSKTWDATRKAAMAKALVEAGNRKVLVSSKTPVAPSPTPAREVSFPIADVVARYEKVVAEFREYELDILGILDRPLLGDMREESTQEFHRAMLDAKVLLPHRSNGSLTEGDPFVVAVVRMEQAWAKANGVADKFRLATFTEQERSRLQKARQLIVLAMDKVSEPSERQVAYRRALKELSGLIEVPRPALDAVESTGVRLELEASS